MKLATLRNGHRDGQLVITNRAVTAYASAADIAPTLQHALDNWSALEAALGDRAAAVEAGTVATTALDPTQLAAPLPRAYEWIDGSAYINHIVLVRKARGAEPPPSLATDPLVYQGGSGVLLGPTDDIVLRDSDWGLDFESELCVIVDDTPCATSRENALGHVRLLTLCNDVSLRNLIPPELKKGFGFLVSKPATAFAPVAITPDELGPAWRDGRIHLRLSSVLNGERVGHVDAGPEMHFSFADLIAHITTSRSLTAGTIVGSGTVSNADPERGISCLAERRMREIIATGSPSTPFMKVGDRIEIEMVDDHGVTVFGRIAQTVVGG
ncbi:MAG TPA: fumarylacetoacetate hydrolase family protein [Kofleriaceae bacterium]|nr:fumarylacetoacetate hydrolase family protein [Kofleriaceae bacterium]